MDSYRCSTCTVTRRANMAVNREVFGLSDKLLQSLTYILAYVKSHKRTHNPKRLSPILTAICVCFQSYFSLLLIHRDFLSSTFSNIEPHSELEYIPSTFTITLNNSLSVWLFSIKRKPPSIKMPDPIGNDAVGGYVTTK